MDRPTTDQNHIYDSRHCAEEHRDVHRSGLVRGSVQGTNGHHRDRKGLLGLSNLGNTCFMNASLQCLSHTHGLQKYFRLCSHAYTCKGPCNRQKLLMSFAHWFERDWGKNVSSPFHSPEDILRVVQQLNPIFQGYAQQDSQEFLRCVLDNMHEELRRDVPDDVRNYLLEHFGVESAGSGEAHESANAGGSRSSTTSNKQRNPPSETCSGASRSRPSSATATSATRQFMQLCQTTEAATDDGEIRLPAVKSVAGTQINVAGTNAGPLGVPLGNCATQLALTPWKEDSSSFTSSTPGMPTGADANPFVCNAVVAGGSSSSGAGPAATGRAGADDGRGVKQTHLTSIISELFQGSVVSTVRCLECQRTSKTKEPMYDVSVQIPTPNELAGGQPLSSGDLANSANGSKGASWTGMFGNVTGKVKSWFYDKGVEITDCIRKFCAPEYLVGKDKYDCEHCKRKTDGERRFAFKDLPEVLCIHIKRFRYDASWFHATKNSRVVTFPVTKHLDMSPFLEAPPPHPVEYRLIGLIQHIGSMGGGHYISYCQHKRKPPEWFEFDDLQVTPVSPDQVERAEPYVLFYQRVTSKSSELDRDSFKTDHRRTEANIRQYLLNHASPKNRVSAEAVDELRYHGPVLRNLFRNPPPELDLAFVSSHWYVRLTTMSNPGPVDNFQYLCPHWMLGCTSVEMAAEPFMAISRALFKSLVQKYGGGPMISSLDICPKCQLFIRAYNERKQAEFELVTKYDTKDTGEGNGWYLVDAAWVHKWKRYVRAENVSEIHDMISPGVVSNTRLLDDKTGRIRPGLKLRSDYIGVNVRVWWLFMHVHGGGPAICRSDLDLYAEGYPVETDLKLDELVMTGYTADFARRTSYLFVEECKGDLEIYQRIYGQGDKQVAPESQDVDTNPRQRHELSEIPVVASTPASV